MIAKTLKRPFYVAVESYKFSRMYPLAQRDITDLCNGNESILDSNSSSLTQGALASLPSGLEFLHPTIDFTPAEYITLLLLI